MARGQGIPRGWWRAFCVELPLVAGTLVFWIAQPDGFLTQSIGIAEPGPPERYLLQLYAGVVGTLVLWFYGRILLAPRIHLPSFRLLQEALALGDVVIVGLGISQWGGPAEPGMLAAQIGMASFWGTLRVLFLLRVREPSDGL